MPVLRKVPQVMFKTTEMSQQVPFFFLFVLWFYPFSFVFFFSFIFFVSVFFYVTEGEKQGSGVDSICGVIKRKMALGFEWWKKEGW
jgi:hypothetical protein